MRQLERNLWQEMIHTYYVRWVVFRRAADDQPWCCAGRLLGTLGASAGGTSKSIRKTLLQFPAEILEKLLSQPFPEPALVPVSIKAYLSLAMIERELGRHQKAIETYGAAIERAEQLGHDFPRDVKYQLLSSHTQAGLALVYQDLRRYQDAEDALQRALNIAQRLAQEHPCDATCHETLAQVLFKLAALYEETGRFSQVDSTLFQVQEPLVKKSRLQPSLDAIEHGLLPQHYQDDGTDAEIKWLHLAVAALRDACETWRVMVQHDVKISNSPDELIGGLTAAEVLYHQIGPDNRDKHHPQDPLDHLDQDHYGYFQLALGRSYEDIDLPKAAKRAYGKAITVFEKLVRVCPEVRKYRIAFLMAQSGMGRMAWDSDEDASRWKGYPRTAMNHQQTTSTSVAASTPN